MPNIIAENIDLLVFGLIVVILYTTIRLLCHHVICYPVKAKPIKSRNNQPAYLGWLVQPISGVKVGIGIPITGLQHWEGGFAEIRVQNHCLIIMFTHFPHENGHNLGVNHFQRHTSPPTPPTPLFFGKLLQKII